MRASGSACGQANFQVYGADKVWRQLNREGVAVARCTVERLMRRGACRGVRRGKALRTTVPDPKAPCPLDRVNRQFVPSDPTSSGLRLHLRLDLAWVYVAFVVDVFSRRIVVGARAVRCTPSSCRCAGAGSV